MAVGLNRVVVVESGSAWFDRDDVEVGKVLGERGWTVEHTTSKRIERGHVPLDRHTLVIGGIPAVRAALRQLGGALPAPDDYPDVVAHHLHRTVWSSTVAALRGRLESGDLEPVFAKSKDVKYVTGRVFRSYEDLRFLAGVSDRRALWCSDVVVWRSEWRVLVIDGREVGRRHYTGEPWTSLDEDVVTDCIGRISAQPGAPAGCAIDFGVLADHTTALVERNDGFSFGAYGLEPTLLAEVLIARWSQLLDSIPVD